MQGLFIYLFQMYNSSHQAFTARFCWIQSEPFNLWIISVEKAICSVYVLSLDLWNRSLHLNYSLTDRKRSTQITSTWSKPVCFMSREW